MFDFAWSEILLIGVVALIAIGPKDMPVAIRTVTNAIKKARRMAAEFQTHVDDMMREADLGDVKKTFNELRSLDLKNVMERAVDPDHSIRNALNDNPLYQPTPSPPASEVSTLDEVAVEARPELADVPAAEPVLAPPEVREAEPAKPTAPAFIPPGLVPPQAAATRSPDEQASDEPPAFIPPHFTRH
ncbi:Sec-independent protein translocase protein TatB [Rhodopila sp.]|uniref:Sec-independent protein translocase protein TatB n=1 Tax=Rhodopila sp. TaxID=2480087 RepID=UPI002B8A70BA|nr:Sec-independent protein translocase protein TatB [Rhodopila sp.]HVZ09496.1 Sec-independent protein translocase protein TatB [Rhodopila sp.]